MYNIREVWRLWRALGLYKPGRLIGRLRVRILVDWRILRPSCSQRLKRFHLIYEGCILTHWFVGVTSFEWNVSPFTEFPAKSL